MISDKQIELLWETINADTEGDVSHADHENFKHDCGEFDSMIAIYNLGFSTGWRDRDERDQ